MRTDRFILTILLVVACAGGLWAGPYDNESPLPEGFAVAREATAAESSTEPSPITGLFMRAGVGLLVIGGLAGVVVWFLRRNPSMRRYLGSAGVVRVVARTWLGSKTGVYLLKVGDRLVLVGASQGGLRTLSEITDPTEVTRMLAEAGGEHAPETARFRDTMRGSLRREAEPRGTAPRPRPSTEVRTRVVADSADPAERLAAIRAELERLQATEVRA
jgi:flagellar biogenesis protein FliO